jgi:hypothetical protein
LTLPSQYILFLMTFLAHNLEYFTFNSSVHNIDTRKRLQLHRPIPNSMSFQRGMYYASKNIFNKLPVCISNLVMDKKHIILVLKRFCIIQSFYSVNEFLDYEYCRCFMRKYCKCCVFVCTFSLFVIVFMTSDCICNHAWIVLWLVSYAIWRFDGSMECICNVCRDVNMVVKLLHNLTNFKLYLLEKITDLT